MQLRDTTCRRSLSVRVHGIARFILCEQPTRRKHSTGICYGRIRSEVRLPRMGRAMQVALNGPGSAARLLPPAAHPLIEARENRHAHTQ